MKEYKLTINGHDYAVRIDRMDDSSADVTVNGTAFAVGIGFDGNAQLKGAATVSRPAAVRPVQTESAVRTSSAAHAAQGAGTTSRKVLSPLPGVINSINVTVGDRVSAGQTVAVLEAMKMENAIEAEKSGTVSAVHVSVGDSIPEGAPIISID
ncbi:MAG: biotin/lipoyl-binding protein [Bacteroidales bacterium]|nr:biotin/lipoyl-binding protein [Candidatus Cryptobacteroides caccocaballi]